MTIDHIGYAVKSMEKAQKAMEQMGYSFTPPLDDTARHVRLAFGEMDGYRVELVAPLDDEAPVAPYLSRIGPTPYHICYRSSRIEEEIAELQEKRFKVTVPLAPAVAFGGKRVVFMYSLSLGLIEIVEE
jgi:methylmalonyl-CoA/ethylmalonyl-CoA epimerase